MGLPGVTELSIIAGVCILLFGGTKIPKLMKGLGEGVRDFKKGISEAKQLEAEIKKEIQS